MSNFKTKMHQIRFRLGLRPRPRWGSLQRSPDPLAGFGALLLMGGEERGGEGREGEEGGEGREGEEGGKGKREGREGEGFKPPQSKFSGYVADPLSNFLIRFNLLIELT